MDLWHYQSSSLRLSFSRIFPDANALFFSYRYKALRVGSSDSNKGSALEVLDLSFVHIAGSKVYGFTEYELW